MAARPATYADVIGLFPALIDVAPSTTWADLLAVYLPIAQRQVWIGAYGENASDAAAALAAHLVMTDPAWVAASGGAAVTSEADGPSSRSFATRPIESDLDLTSAGSLYAMLKRTATVGRGLVANGYAMRGGGRW